MPLFAVYGSFGWFNVPRGASFNFDEAEYVFVPPD
jgi:hypothetical protein